MKREKEALFPPKDYMEGLFPVLKKFPWLYSMCCLLRLFRILFSKVKQFFAGIRDGLKEKLRAGKNRESELSDSQEENEKKYKDGVRDEEFEDFTKADRFV